ncbi:mannitol-1-phosphate 5-dehydrogenase [Cohnella nanjingensis]|uniref:Mannitol-1-phosphate 5-dehydrogenase n=1 Tax=Cohnella nanjingensis TaxID=1387779 RepID=A0A7X0RTJ4_9BACL|nr:mannitol-1-phosphate 5-dehydrogenase [Cohnella nanjingensis]MBB6671914.1 mannitol-1-phosphate 5-dehydrogenase [Cohnella nanjingensis]
MKAVHFGAGNIGLGFIGLLLSRAGYELRFVDVSEERVSLLNERGAYRVTLANEEAETTTVSGVSAIHGRETERVARAIAEADLVTTAVGLTALPYIAESIAKGIELRLGGASGAGAAGVAPLAVIACENAIGGSTALKQHVYGYLSPALQERAAGRIAFPDAAVDRIVPLQQHEDPLQVTVEPFYEWVVDRSALPEGYPLLDGVHYVDRLGPYIERKLFTVNTGHCSAAYHGYLKGYATIQEAMRDEEIVALVRGVLGETGAVLVRQYGFDETEHGHYIDQIIERFRNPYLTDEVVRVGRSPIRKLAANDRLVRPAMLAQELGIGTAGLTGAMAAALRFDYADDPEAAELQRSLREQGLSETLVRYTGIPAGHPLHDAVTLAYEALGRLHPETGASALPHKPERHDA